MKLLKLCLRNFKGCRDLLLEPGGRDLSIFGDNATGKTTAADAFYWLLFDKDSSNRKDFEIKTLDANGRAIPNLEHEVYAELEHSDGTCVTLQKTYKENWVQKRGNARKEFTGHSTDYKVNLVPQDKTEYDRYVAGICNEKLFRILTDPGFFNSDGMKETNSPAWQERRKMLLSICGDVRDEDVIASSPALKDLTDLLQGYSIEQRRKMLTAQRKEINENLGKLPVRIDELTRVPKPEGGAVSLEALRTELKDLGEQRSRLAAGGEVAQIKKQLAEEQALLQVRRNELSAQQFEEGNALRSKLAEAETTSSAVQSQIERLTMEIGSCDNGVESVDRQLEKLRGEFQLENETSFSFTGQDTCAACGQALPAEKVAEARAKAEGDWNAAKARRLEANRAEGTSLKAKRDIAAEKAKVAREKALELTGQLAEANKVCENLKAHLSGVTVSEVDVSMDEQHFRIAGSIVDLEKSLSEVEGNLGGQLIEVDSKIEGVNSKVALAEGEIAAMNEYDRARTRIAELEAEEKTLAAEIEQIDKTLFLAEEFIRAKVSMLEEKINSRFELAKFKLFDTQINEGIRETCETTFEGVPYGSGLNHGARLNVGLDIINTLAEHHGFAPVIFIDNCESVTKILPTKGQQIKLFVSESDKSLRVEAAQPQGAGAAA